MKASKLHVTVKATRCRYLDRDGIERPGVFGEATFKGRPFCEIVSDAEGNLVDDALAVRTDVPHP